MHARSGGNIEVMGMIQGKVEGSTMIVMDVFALPVEGSETRVNAQAEAYEHIVKYTELIKQVGRLENTIGWYHSHPGYGCWLSGIDVTTQSIQQKYSDPFVAIVVRCAARKRSNNEKKHIRWTPHAQSRPARSTLVPSAHIPRATKPQTKGPRSTRRSP